VEQYWGDSVPIAIGNEYMMTLPPESVAQLYKVLRVEEGNKELLLDVLVDTFETNECFSELKDLLTKNNIHYEHFSWT
jgi:hypothetical protein